MSSSRKRGRGRPPADPQNPRRSKINVFVCDRALSALQADQREGETLGTVVHRWIMDLLDLGNTREQATEPTHTTPEQHIAYLP